MRRTPAERAGFTLVEVLLALGLLSLLVVALVRLLDTSLKIWERTETTRDLQEMGGAVLDLLAEDLYALESGPRGDLVGDWVRFDLDRDGSPGALWPRLRCVRQASAADLMRARPVVTQDNDGVQVQSTIDPREKGLMEVCWAVLPAGNAARDERQLGNLWRGERLLGDDSLSFFDERYFGSGGKPAPGTLDLVTGGVLWFDLWYAAQTSIVHDGWSLGDDLSDGAASWDAWNKDRPDLAKSYLNEPAAGMATAHDLPILPRRVLIRVEIERPADLKRRTRLTVVASAESNELLIADEQGLPDKDAMVLVDEEWMRVLSTGRGYALVQRAQRGTRASIHEAGTMIHWGNPMTRELPVPTMREEWDL